MSEVEIFITIGHTTSDDSTLRKMWAVVHVVAFGHGYLAVGISRLRKLSSYSNLFCFTTRIDSELDTIVRRNYVRSARG